MLRQKTRRSLQVVRAASAVVLLVVVGLFVATRNRAAGVRLSGKWRVEAAAGCLRLGRTPGWAPPAAGVFYRGEDGGWYADFGLAWRPIHVKVGGGNQVYFPLWHVMVVSALALGWSHGTIRGMARFRPGMCQHCGYDLTRTAAVEGVKVCPECGHRGVTTRTGG